MFSYQTKGRRVPSAFGISVLFILLLAYKTNVCAQLTIEYDSTLLCSSNTKANEAVSLRKSVNGPYLLVLNKSKNQVFLLHYKLETNGIDTLLRYDDNMLPFDFQVTKKETYFYGLYGDYVVQYSLKNTPEKEPKPIKVNTGKCSSIGLYRDSFLIVNNYINQGLVDYPKVEYINLFDENKSLFVKKLKLKNHHAFFSSISPHQNRQITYTDKGFYFYDKISGGIEYFDYTTKNSKILRPAVSNIQLLDNIKNRSKSYHRNNTFSNYEKLEALEARCTNMIYQFCANNDDTLLEVMGNENVEHIESFQIKLYSISKSNITIIKEGSFNLDSCKCHMALAPNNFSLNEIVSWPFSYFKNQLYIFQSFNTCLNDADNLGQLIITKMNSPQEKRWVLNRYNLNYLRSHK